MEGSSVGQRVLARHGSAIAAALGRGPVADFVTSALRLDADALERDLERMRRRHPGETHVELARRCVRIAAWSAGAVSLVLGLPDHPVLWISAAAIEAVVVRHIRLVALARVAMLHEPHMLAAGRDPVAVLQDVAGQHAAREAALALCSRAAKKGRKAALRRVVKMDAPRVAGAVCKHLGAKACSRSILRLIPVLGAVVGAAGTARAVRREMECAFPHLAMRALPRGGAALRPRNARSGGAAARRAAVEIVAAGIRTGDVLAIATHKSRRAISSFIAEARARARVGTTGEFARAA